MGPTVLLTFRRKARWGCFRPEKSDGFGRVWTRELGYQRPIDQCYFLQCCYEVSSGNSLSTFLKILLSIFQSFSYQCTALLGSFRPTFFRVAEYTEGHSSTGRLLNLWIITPRGVQIAQYRSPRRLIFFFRCRLIFVSPPYGTGFVSWRLEF
jgi:hypothetical protein